MKTAVIYARYSSDRQTEQSIEGQLRICNEYAEKNDIVIVDTYIDRAMTGTNDQRPDFQRMIKDSAKRQFEIVLVYKLDRFSRNKYETAIHKKTLRDNGVKVVSAMENIPDTPEGIILESLLEGMSAYYSAELSQKSKRGLNETRLKGNFIGGRVAFGWDKVDHKLVINENEAPIVREIFNTYLSGETMQQISNNLNERGIINKDRPFYHCTIYTMLHNEKYTGIYKVDGKVYDKIFPPIVPMDTFELVQKKLHENSCGKHIPDVTYLLRGKVDCGYCGKRFTSFAGTDRYGNKRRYYHCGNKNCHKQKSIKKDDLENAVMYAIEQVIGTENNIEFLANGIIEQRKQRAKNNSTLHLLENELDETKKSIAGIMKAIEMGIVTETTKERLEELEKQKHELTKNIAIEKSQYADDVSKEMIKDYLRNSFTKPRQIMIDSLIEKITIFSDRIDITLKYTSLTPPDGDRPKRWHRYCKDSDPNDRGSLFISYDYLLTTYFYRKEFITPIKLGICFRV